MLAGRKRSIASLGISVCSHGLFFSLVQHHFGVIFYFLLPNFMTFVRH